MEKLSLGSWSVPSSSCDLGHWNLPLFQSSRLSILLYQERHYFEKTFLVEAKFIMINTGPFRIKYALIERGGLESYQAGWTPKLCGGGAGSSGVSIRRLGLCGTHRGPSRGILKPLWL